MDHIIDDRYTANCVWLRISAGLLVNIFKFLTSIRYAQTSMLMLQAGPNLQMNTTGATQELCLLLWLTAANEQRATS